MSAVHPLDLSAPSRATVRCRYCEARLDASRGDFINRRVCVECRKHPESRDRHEEADGSTRSPVSLVPPTGAPRAFTLAEKSLIRKVHGFLPAQQLLDVLNERLLADLGPHAHKYTMEHLQAELSDTADNSSVQTSDWAGLRKALAHARRSGLLQQITPQIVDDFAVVYQLSAPQVLRLKEVLGAPCTRLPTGDAA